MRSIILLFLATATAASAQAPCASCSDMEKRFTRACESHLTAMAEVGERHPAKVKNMDPKQLKTSAHTYCRCVFSKNEQMLAGDFEILIEMFSLEEMATKSLTAALSGNTAAARDYEALQRKSRAFSEKAGRMIGKDKLEKSGWLQQKFCSPMIEKFMGDFK